MIITRRRASIFEKSEKSPRDRTCSIPIPLMDFNLRLASVLLDATIHFRDP